MTSGNLSRPGSAAARWRANRPFQFEVRESVFPQRVGRRNVWAVRYWQSALFFPSRPVINKCVHRVSELSAGPDKAAQRGLLSQDACVRAVLLL